MAEDKTVKEGDFIELIYVGREKDSGRIFDLNDEKVAKENNIYDPKASYKGHIICVGQGDILKSLDKALVGHKVGERFKVELKAEEAFGKKNPKLFQMIPLNKFKDFNTRPYPGMVIEVDGMQGTVKLVSSGRVIVDFNHPLSGKDVVYEIFIKREVTDDKEKVKAFFEILGIRDLEYKDGVVELPVDLPEDLLKELEKKLKERLPAVKSVVSKKEKANSKNNK